MSIIPIVVRANSVVDCVLVIVDRSLVMIFVALYQILELAAVGKKEVWGGGGGCSQRLAAELNFVNEKTPCVL